MNNKGADQTARMCRLIRTSVVCRFFHDVARMVSKKLTRFLFSTRLFSISGIFNMPTDLDFCLSFSGESLHVINKNFV